MTNKVNNIILLLLIAAFMVLMAACNAGMPEESLDVIASDELSEPDADASAAGEPITDLKTGDAELHEPIAPLEFEDGEEVANPFYKRTVNEDGTPCYLVMNATTNQFIYLPMGQTVIYTGEYETCFYERYTITYTQGGEPKSTTQYQLFVNAKGDFNPGEEADSGSVVNESTAG